MSQGSEKYVEVLKFILDNLTEHPETISISTKTVQDDVNLLVQVSKDDMGLVIGRGGVMANSIKTIITSIAVNDGVNVSVKFVEPDKK